MICSVFALIEKILSFKITIFDRQFDSHFEMYLTLLFILCDNSKGFIYRSDQRQKDRSINWLNISSIHRRFISFVLKATNNGNLRLTAALEAHFRVNLNVFAYC